MISLKSAILLGVLLAVIVTIWEQWRDRKLYAKFEKMEQYKELIASIDFWRMKYLEAYKEVVKANKGIRRLKNKLKKHNHANPPEPPA